MVLKIIFQLCFFANIILGDLCQAGSTSNNCTSCPAGTYNSTNSVTSVKMGSMEVPSKFELHQNYPNPFNPSTVIRFNIPETGTYSMKVYNVIGQLVSTLANGQFEAGSYTINFDASGLPSGLYVYQMTGKNVNVTKKMLLQK